MKALIGIIIIGIFLLFSFSENVFGMPPHHTQTDKTNPVDTWEEYGFIAFAVGSMALAIIWSSTYKFKKEIKK